MPETEKRYTLSLYFDVDNPTGRRLLAGNVWKTYTGKYRADYSFQIAPGNGQPNSSCDEYPEWKSPDTYDTAEGGLVMLQAAVEQFEKFLVPMQRLWVLDKKIAEIQVRKQALDDQWRAEQALIHPLVIERRDLKSRLGLDDR